MDGPSGIKMMIMTNMTMMMIVEMAIVIIKKTMGLVISTRRDAIDMLVGPSGINDDCVHDDDDDDSTISYSKRDAIDMLAGPSGR